MDAGGRDVGVALEVLLAGAAQPHEGRDRRGSDAPHPVRILVADDSGQRVAAREELERAGLAVVVDERDRRLPLRLGDRQIRRGHVAREILPAVHVGEELLQIAHLLVLERARSRAEGARVPDVALHRQHRHGERRQQHGREREQTGDRRHGDAPPPAGHLFEGDAAACEQRRVGGRDVLGLGVGVDQENREHGQEGHAHGAEPLPLAVEKAPREPRQRDQEGERVHVAKLVPQEAEARQRRVLLGGGVAHELEVGEPVLGVPDDERQEDEERQQPRRVRASALELAAQPGEGDGDDDSGCQPHDADLVEHAKAEEQSEPQPREEAGAFDHAKERVGRQQPEENVEAVHREEGVERHQVRRREEAQGRENHRRPPAPHATDQQAEHRRGKARRERRDQPDGEQGFAEQEPRRRHQEDRERRLVHVPKGEVLAARDVVQLVPEPPVPAKRVDRQVHAQRQQGQSDDRPGVTRPCLRTVRIHHRFPPVRSRVYVLFGPEVQADKRAFLGCGEQHWYGCRKRVVTTQPPATPEPGTAVRSPPRTCPPIGGDEPLLRPT